MVFDNRDANRRDLKAARDAYIEKQRAARRKVVGDRLEREAEHERLFDASSMRDISSDLQFQAGFDELIKAAKKMTREQLDESIMKLRKSGRVFSTRKLSHKQKQNLAQAQKKTKGKKSWW